jgi:hypothetical protein
MITIPTIKPPHITHLAVLNEDLEPVVVMCLRQKPRHLNPDQATWSEKEPSCPVCYRKYHEARA